MATDTKNNILNGDSGQQSSSGNQEANSQKAGDNQATSSSQAGNERLTQQGGYAQFAPLSDAAVTGKVDPPRYNELQREVNESVGSGNSISQQQTKAGGSMTYEEMVRQMSPYKAPSPEEVEAERRRQKRNATFAAISDGLAAFHSAFAKARGTTPMVEVGYSQKARERYERLQREREAHSQEYLNALMRARQADESKEQTSWRNRIEEQRQERLDRETEIKAEKAAAYREYQNSVTSKNEEMAAYYKAKWEALEAGKDVDIALKEAKAAQARAKARLDTVRADAGGFAPRSNGGGVGGYTVTETRTTTDKHGRKSTVEAKKVRTPAGQQQGQQQSGSQQRQGQQSGSQPKQQGRDKQEKVKINW